MSDTAGNDHQGSITRLANYVFLLLVASLGFPQFPIHLFDRDVLATDLLFLLTGAFCVFDIFLGARKLRWQNYFLTLFAYVAAMTVSAVFSVGQPASFARLPAEAYLICLAVLSFCIIDSRSMIKRTLLAWLAGTSVAVFIGVATIALFYVQSDSQLLESLTYHYGSVPVGNYPRLTAGFVSASMLCNYLNVGFVLALLALRENWLPRKLAVILCLVIAVVAAFTISIGLGGLALAAGIWVLFSTKIERHLRNIVFATGCLVAIAFLIVSLFALAPYPGAHIIFKIPFTNVELMPSARMLVWADALSTLLSHPMTGIGLGEPVANVVFANTDGTLSLLTDAHNSFLSVAAQNGIIGLATFVALTALVLKRWVQDVRNAYAPTILVVAGLAFISSFVYQGLTGSFEDARHLWVLIGIFWAADSVKNDRD
jgi:O-antigen ligase